jgi:hypothetical protein
MTDAARELVDRMAVADTVTRMAWCLDRRDWDGLAGLFTERVYTDYTSLWGGTPQEATVDELLSTDRQGSWRRTMDGLDATQHLVTNILVELGGDEAGASANVVGHHRLANPHGDLLWTVGGTYAFRLVRAGGWRIRAITMKITWARGNQHVLALALARAGSGTERRAA